MSQQAKMQKLTSCVKMVRDILRREGICDMDSMAHCVLFVGARMLNDSVGNLLNIDKRWCILLEHVKSKRIDEANQYFRDIMETFDTIFDTRDFGYKLEGRDNFKDIILAFDDVDVHEITKETDVLGYIYEQHLSTGSGSGRDLGKYYTDRSITRYLTHLCAPKIINNRPESVCDVTMGTGGFLLSYINYITDIAIKNNKTINWRDYDILGGDIDPRVAAIAKMNVFLKTGKLFPYVSRRNTLYSDITDDKAKADIVLMNVPFGVKGLIHKNCCQRVKDVIKEGTKSEPLFSFLGCEIVNLGGRGAIIVPDGVLDNNAKIYVNFRKYMLEKFDVKRIIKMKGKFFMNTTIQPSVLFFEYSGKPTSSVEFWEANKGNNGEIEDILVLSVPREKFVDDFSFSLRKYLPTVAVVNTMNYPMKHIKEVMNVVSGKANQDREVGRPVPYYDSNGVIGYVAEPLYTGEYTITARNLSIGAVHYINGPFYPSDHTINFTSLNQNVINNRFFYNWLHLNNQVLKDLSSGIKPGIRKSDVAEILMPVPPIEFQKEIVTNLDRIFADMQDMKDCLGFTDKAMDLMLKDPTGKQLEDVLSGLRLKRAYVNDAASMKSQMAAVMRSVGARGFERKKLGDITSMVKGNAFKSEEFKTEGFPILRVSDLQNRMIDTTKLLYTPQNNKYNQFLVKKNDILLVVTGSTGKLAVNNTNLEFYLNQNAVVLRANNQYLEQQYLFHSLLSDDFQNLISNGLSGSAQPFVSCKSINEFDIPLPPIPVQHEVLAILNEMEAELQTLEQMAAKAEQRAKFILDGYLTPAPQAVEAEPVVDPNSIAAFIEKHIVHEDGAEVPFKKVAQKYKEWATARPEHKLLPLAELKPALSLVLGDLENEKYKGIKLI